MATVMRLDSKRGQERETAPWLTLLVALLGYHCHSLSLLVTTLTGCTLLQAMSAVTMTGSTGASMHRPVNMRELRSTYRAS